MAKELKLYVAGGFHGTWREKVAEAIQHKMMTLDPLTPELDENGKRKNLSFEEYSAWDLWAIRTADIVFVYVEATNPGIGALVEAGYAKGLGKTVILVLEPNHKTIPDRYLKFVEAVSDYHTDTFEKGLEVLGKFCY